MTRTTGIACAALILAVGIGCLSAFAADNTPPTNSAPHKLDKGGLALTFDDRNFDNWLKAMPLFEKYGAKATFFVSGVIDRQALDGIRQLRSHGHAIGCHGVRHLKAVDYFQQHSAEEYLRNEIRPQVEALQAAGITPTSFAYPSSRNDAATDGALLQVFRHLRTGGFLASGQEVSKRDLFFVPADKISAHGCLHGKGIDGAPAKDRTFEQLDAALARAAKNKEVVVFYAHDIAATGKSHHVAPEALEHVLRTAKELGLKFYTFDDLP